ncbi:MAG: nucleotidyltransferase domain-containing protein [Puniceicoccales bacterium]|jgi:predicted nucleotidyltransferase|nr:nucleotidyltransferase domain-containing protein [Puniceicoccales bacterium]
MAAIDLAPEQMRLVRKIFDRYLPGSGATVYVFGSRATGKARKFSDLDLAVDYPEGIPEGVSLALKNEFEESNFPYFVDIIDYHRCEGPFQRIIDRTKILLVRYDCQSTK